jgi:hypothetical protein
MKSSWTLQTPDQLRFDLDGILLAQGITRITGLTAVAGTSFLTGFVVDFLAVFFWTLGGFLGIQDLGFASKACRRGVLAVLAELWIL